MIAAMGRSTRVDASTLSVASSTPIKAVAAASGLPLRTGAPGEAPLFCGDAIADPLAGLHAAVAALAAWRSGAGGVLDIALRDVCAHALAFRPDTPGAHVVRDAGQWVVEAGGDRTRVAPPRARAPRRAARGLGADTTAVLAELPC